MEAMTTGKKADGDVSGGRGQEEGQGCRSTWSLQQHAFALNLLNLLFLLAFLSSAFLCSFALLRRPSSFVLLRVLCLTLALLMAVPTPYVSTLRNARSWLSLSVLCWEFLASSSKLNVPTPHLACPLPCPPVVSLQLEFPPSICVPRLWRCALVLSSQQGAWNFFVSSRPVTILCLGTCASKAAPYPKGKRKESLRRSTIHRACAWHRLMSAFIVFLSPTAHPLSSAKPIHSVLLRPPLLCCQVLAFYPRGQPSDRI